MEKDERSASLKAGGKARELLEILVTEGGRACSLSALSRKAGLSRYKTSRLLADLEGKGLVEREVESGRYDVRCEERPANRPVPPPGTIELSRSKHPVPFVDDQSLYQAILQGARPVLESLARRHNEAMYLTILNGSEVLFLDMVDCHWQVRAEPFVGRRFPFFSNAAGKVMRAIDSWDLLEKIGKRWRQGQGGYPDLTALRAELELIREKGVAVDCGGMGDGIITVAVAVRDYAGKVVGALTMLGPSVRLLGERLEDEIIPSLLLSGELLSMQFGYAPL